MTALKKAGSTTSLQTLMEPIPVEYHRKVLKKIAQLTKVIHILHTKSDENESCVESIRAAHESERQKMSADNLVKLQGLQEKFQRVKELKEQELQKLNAQLEMERLQAHKTQELHSKEAADALNSMKAQHTQELQTLNKRFDKQKNDHANKTKELTDLLAATREQMKVLEAKHKTEAANNREEISLLKASHKEEFESLEQQHQSVLQKLESGLHRTQNELLVMEREKWEQEQRTLQSKFSEKEEALNKVASKLSNELRTSSDKLALAEQKIKDLEADLEAGKRSSNNFEVRISGAQEEVDKLKEENCSLKSELAFARDQYQEQKREMLAVSSNVRELEALKVSNEGIIKEQQASLTTLRARLKHLEDENEDLMNSQKSDTQKSSARIKSLENALENMKRKQQDLHLQYAHEIEAAHSERSQREKELEDEYEKAMQGLKMQCSKEIKAAATEHEKATSSLKKETESTLQSCYEKHQSEVAVLQGVISSKEDALTSVQNELDRLKRETSGSKRNIGYANTQIETLRKELSLTEEKVRIAQQQCKAVTAENKELKACLDRAKREHQATVELHYKQIEELKVSLTKKLEAHWMQKVKEECAELRAQMSQCHAADLHSALAELASLKDTAMASLQDQHQQDRKKLKEEILQLQHQLLELQNSSNKTLKEVKTDLLQQLGDVRKTLEEEREKHDCELTALQSSQHQQLQAMMQDFEKQKKLLIDRLEERHNIDMQSFHQANQLAVAVMKEEWEKQKEEITRKMDSNCKKQLDKLHVELMQQQESALSSVRADYKSELEMVKKQHLQMLRESDSEVAKHASTIRQMDEEMNKKVMELNTLREKVDKLKTSENYLRKELKVKSHEVISTKQEAKNYIHVREKQMSSAHQAEIDSLLSQHKHQTHMLLMEFNKAKELLNCKLSGVEKKLCEMEERYQNRESRPEDLQAIRELRQYVHKQEQKIQELMSEMRVYQLELMNREKNYNKLFSATPNVGVLDPLKFLRKRMDSDKLDLRHASAPSLSSSPTADLSAHFTSLDTIQPKPPPVPLENDKHPINSRTQKLLSLNSNPSVTEKKQKQPSRSRHVNPKPHETPPTPPMPKQMPPLVH